MSAATRFRQLERKCQRIPLILKLGVDGTPRKWIHWHDATTLAFNGKIKWSYGNPIILRGGINSFGKESLFELPPVIAADAAKRVYRTPPLCNRELFRRDRLICGYCGKKVDEYRATRDHIVPTSRGGKNTWSNVVCCCEGCNRFKADRLMDECGMQLIYVPYAPCAAEFLLLQSRNVLADQMEYLEKQIPQDSRYWQEK